MTRLMGLVTGMVAVAWGATAAGISGQTTRPASQSASSRTSQPSSSPVSKPSSQPRQELTLDLGNKVSMKLVLVPAGKFTMGSPEGEKGRGTGDSPYAGTVRAPGGIPAAGAKDRPGNEGPQREVTISRPFFMGIYEVTQEQYEQIVGRNPSHFKDPQNPVEYVSAEDAMAFCEKVSKKTGKRVLLPTEAQWEYACRAGSQTRFNFGDDEKDLGDHAWYKDNSDGKTHPVGQKKPNAWGLYDMHGNVWEWCRDWYGDSYADAQTTDPIRPAAGKGHLLRGGCWYYFAHYARSAQRWPVFVGRRDSVFGFRVVVDP